MSEPVPSGADRDNPPPPALRSSNPLRWLTLFGPGAVIASLTIGAGELIFSTRAGAIFGYRLLWFFLLVLLLKWVLVYVTARHMMLTGVHPFQRWCDLPGPRGWLPLVFLLLALWAFPIWVGFHAGTTGTLLSRLAGTEASLNGGAHFLWGIAVLSGVLVLVAAGGYAALERVQLVIVLLMLACVSLSLLVVKPDWLQLLAGIFVPQSVHYPDWVLARPEFTGRPVWVETITYVGVLGGSGYDYLAYVSYLRDKGWGRAGRSAATAAELEAVATNRSHPDRVWLRAILADSVLSFLAVLIFTAVFVACGVTILGPQEKIPSGGNLLALQAEFVTPLHPWLKHVYFAGAFLTIFGTLYGTIEVAPAIFRELASTIGVGFTRHSARRLRRWAVAWVGLGGLVVLTLSLFLTVRAGATETPELIRILTPANLFTGVLACGLICLLAVVSDFRHLPRGLRPGFLLLGLNLAAGIAFVLLGLKAYWDYGGPSAWVLLAATLALGWIAASALSRFGK